MFIHIYIADSVDLVVARAPSLNALPLDPSEADSGAVTATHIRYPSTKSRTSNMVITTNYPTAFRELTPMSIMITLPYYMIYYTILDQYSRSSTSIVGIV